MKLPPKAVEHHIEVLSRSMQSWRLTQKVPPVLLLTGPSGIGKLAIAHQLAQWIHCKTQGLEVMGIDSYTPCWNCLPCRKALLGQDLDIIEIQSEGESESSLKIDQFRDLKTSAGFGAHENLYKIILIPSADRMTPAASNSMLKLLEEPPAQWIFILTCNDATLLLPTLVSRCQIIKLKPFSQELIESFLRSQRVPDERVLPCAQLAQGSYKRAFEFASNEIWDQRPLFFGLLEDPNKIFSVLLDWISKDKTHLEILIDFLEQLLSEMIQWSVQSPLPSPSAYSWSQIDGKAAIVSQIQWALKRYEGLTGARSFWMKRAERLAQARQELLAPINRKIIAQDLLAPWLGAAA